METIFINPFAEHIFHFLGAQSYIIFNPITLKIYVLTNIINTLNE